MSGNQNRLPQINRRTENGVETGRCKNDAEPENRQQPRPRSFFTACSERFSTQALPIVRSPHSLSRHPHFCSRVQFKFRRIQVNVTSISIEIKASSYMRYTRRDVIQQRCVVPCLPTRILHSDFHNTERREKCWNQGSPVPPRNFTALLQRTTRTATLSMKSAYSCLLAVLCPRHHQYLPL